MRRLCVRIRYHAVVTYYGGRTEDTVNSSEFDYEGGRLEDYIKRFDAGELTTHAPEGATAIWAQFFVPGKPWGGLRFHPLHGVVYSRRWQAAFAADDPRLAGALDRNYHMLPGEAP